jgi:hypothetical protein
MDVEHKGENENHSASEELNSYRVNNNIQKQAKFGYAGRMMI